MENCNKIPKIIHCCWLSGDTLPAVYQQCIDSWKIHMPDYEIMLWDMDRSPTDVLFVRQAIEARKWAYAADYIRLYALYHHGGIYLDMDVMVYKSFDPFLIHSAFSSIEFNPHFFYKTLKDKIPIGLGIEAAVLGTKKGHPWIKDILSFYADKEFINNPKYYWSIIMPRVMTKVSAEKYGFKYVPVYQVLEEDIHLYPCDVFSSSYNLALGGETNISKLGDSNPIRFSYHICAHSWWEGNTHSNFFLLKKWMIKILGKNNISKLKSKIIPPKDY